MEGGRKGVGGRGRWCVLEGEGERRGRGKRVKERERERERS